MKDKQGRAYAKVTDTKIGSRVRVDASFDGIRSGASRVVKKDEYGLYIDCRTRSDSRHYLDGQLSSDGAHYIGLYPCE